MELKPDLGAALKHIQWLTGEADPQISWQVFDNSKTNPHLARSYFGTLQSVKGRLIAAQDDGCGVFIAVNETDGEGRRKENMRRFRAAFLDLDGAPLPEAWPIQPGLIANSSPSKYQVWWSLAPGAEFDAKRTVNTRQAGQQSDDAGQLARASR